MKWALTLPAVLMLTGVSAHQPAQPQATGWVCSTVGVTGFWFDTSSQKWKMLTSSDRPTFIIRRPVAEDTSFMDKGAKWLVKTVGQNAIRDVACEDDFANATALLFCDSMNGHVEFSRQQGRMILTRSWGFFEDAAWLARFKMTQPDDIYTLIATCSAL